jgi:ribosomal protein S18 acetylase RimI-like enzyme
MKLVAPSTDVECYLDLEYRAAEPYLSFVYDDEREAREITRFLFAASAGEGATGRLVVDESFVPIAMISYLDAPALRRARSAAAIALVRAKKIDPRGAVRERMLLATETLAPLEDNDFYLSRIAVVPAAQGSGVATRLMGELDRAAAEAQKTRIVLEVSEMHRNARRLYERCGYRVIATADVEDARTQRHLRYFHMVKS